MVLGESQCGFMVVGNDNAFKVKLEGTNIEVTRTNNCHFFID